MKKISWRGSVLLFALALVTSSLAQTDPGGGPAIRCSPDLVLLTCSNSAVGNYAAPPGGEGVFVVCTPASGSDFPLGVSAVTCLAFNSTGGFESCSFNITVRPSPPASPWPCTWLAGLGIPFELVGGATATVTPDADPESPAISLFPTTGVPVSGLLLHPGPAQGLAFSTVLDFTAPVGSGFDLFLPPDPMHPNDPPVLSFRNKGSKGYCVKMNKRFATDPGPAARAVVVNTNGQFLEPLSFSAAEIEANGVFDIGFQPGVSNCHITVEMNCEDGTVSVEFPGPIVPAANGRKGWDGCIYGPDRPIKKPTSRVTLIPPPSPGTPPITDLYLYASGMTELPVQQPTITALGRRWGDGHVTLMKAYDDEAARSLEFHALDNGGGVHTDLGAAASFELFFDGYESGGSLNREHLFRISTNRPTTGPTFPPLSPPMEARLTGSSTGVVFAVDYRSLGISNVTVELRSGGSRVSIQFGFVYWIDAKVCTLDRWPSVLGCPGAGALRLADVAPFTVHWPNGSSEVGDELIITPEAPPGTPVPNVLRGLECVASAGVVCRIRDLQVTPVAPVAPLTINCPSDIITPPTDPTGAVVSYFPTVLFGDCPLLPLADITCTPPSGSTFPLGVTTVTCTGHNGCGETPSCSFTVTVAAAPVITLQPKTQLLPQCPGPTGYGDVSLTVEATGTPAPVFYWSALCPPQFPNCGCILRPPQPGSATLVLPNFTPECAAGYFVVVSNAAGSVTSVVAQVVVAPEVAYSDNRFPPPNSRFEVGRSRYLLEGAGLPPVEVVISNLTLRLPGSGQALPAPGAIPTLVYDVEAACEMSTDGGNTFQAVACSGQMSLRAQHTGDFLPAQNWRIEITGLSLSGGSLPGSLMLRESPTLPSRGKTTIRQTADGTYRSSSFFDIFMEVSLNGGVSWGACVDGSCRALLQPVTHEFSPPDDHFPPLGSEISQAVKGTNVCLPNFLDLDADNDGIAFALPNGGGVISVSHLNLQPHGGSVLFDSLVIGQDIDLDCDTYLDLVTVDGSSRYSAPATLRVRLDHRASTISRLQVVSLDVSGGLLPAGFKLRESPTLPSLGYASRRANGDGTYRISSFFDIFTEVSLDGGATWSPGSRPVGVGTRPAVPEMPLVITCPPDQLLLTCSNSAVVYFQASAVGQVGAVVCTPPSGSDFPLGGTPVLCVATNASGGLAECSFTVTVKTAPASWACRQVGIGLPYEPVGGATVMVRPDTGDGDPAIVISPAPGNPSSGVRFVPGPAQAITFTTVLDFTAPVGAGFELVLPPDPAHPNQPPLLSFRNKGSKGYCVKTAKAFDDEPDLQARAFVVNTNGDLLDPLSFTPAEIDANGLFDIGFQPGVSNCHITITLSCVDGRITVEFPGPIGPAALGRKGWDGCIYGPDRPVKKGTSRVMFIPPVSPGAPPITELFLYASGGPSITVEQPSITASGRKWGDGHVTLMKAYDDGDLGVEFRSFAPGGGVHVELGHSESFNVRLKQLFQDGEIPKQDELLTRTLGPIRGLTNRPPPPYLDAMLLQGAPGAIECSADFRNLDSPTVHVLLYSNGVVVAQRTGLTALLGQSLFTLPDWPETLGKLGGATPCRRGTFKPGIVRLPGGSSFGFGEVDEFIGADEFRVLAELPPGAPHPDFYSGFEFIASEGPTWRVSNVERNLICTPGPISSERSAEGLTLSWSGEGFRLEGAESVSGPWFDLGVASPVTLGPNHPGRYFRLLCD